LELELDCRHSHGRSKCSSYPDHRGYLECDPFLVVQPRPLSRSLSTEWGHGLPGLAFGTVLPLPRGLPCPLPRPKQQLNLLSTREAGATGVMAATPAQPTPLAMWPSTQNLPRCTPPASSAGRRSTTVEATQLVLWGQCGSGGLGAAQAGGKAKQMERRRSLSRWLVLEVKEQSSSRGLECQPKALHSDILTGLLESAVHRTKLCGCPRRKATPSCASLALSGVRLRRQASTPHDRPCQELERLAAGSGGDEPKRGDRKSSYSRTSTWLDSSIE